MGSMVEPCIKETAEGYKTFLDSIRSIFSEKDKPLNFLLCSMAKIFHLADRWLKYFSIGILRAFMEHLEVSALLIIAIVILIRVTSRAVSNDYCVNRAPDITKGETYANGCVSDYKGEEIKNKDDLVEKNTTLALSLMQGVLTPLTMFVMPTFVLSLGIKKLIESGYIPKIINIIAGDKTIDSLPKLTTTIIERISGDVHIDTLPKLTTKILGEPTVTGTMNRIIQDANKNLIPSVIRPVLTT